MELKLYLIKEFQRLKDEEPNHLQGYKIRIEFNYGEYAIIDCSDQWICKEKTENSQGRNSIMHRKNERFSG